ncbi:phosphatase PAP2 family protein [Micromonospora sp. NPDC048871]|uniref:phosphatase PAP2 family protein n=1 Tax=unclassified Micromonospora TaxID=2617518 RepID=UPI002E0E088C|nr:phosphatase PAP2 family protein [Micromonospora sp. NBC_01739]
MRVRVTPRGGTAVWLVGLALVQTAVFIVVWRFALYSELGQWVDTVALTGNRIGRDHIEEPVNRILNAMSVVSLLAATVMIGFIALIRGRVALAVAATLLIVGANVTTQVLKYGLVRPDYGIDPERAGVGNSLPSGHTTVAASVAVALVLVLPPKVRAFAAVVGAAYSAVAGVATLSAGWHRPSDAVAAYLVVGVWAALAGILLLITQREQAQVSSADAHRGVALLLGIGGLLLILACALALFWLTSLRPTAAADLSRQPLFVGYAGSAAGIAGTMGVVMALAIAAVHRIVPRHKG